MADLFASGRIVDLIIALMIVEIACLAVYHRRTGRGVDVRALLVNGAAGLALLLALRASLTGSGWETVAVALAGSLFAHMADLAVRWKR